MAVPKYDELMDPVIRAMHNLGGKATVSEIDREVAKILNLSSIDLNVMHTRTRTKLSYRLAWARNYLKRFGLIETFERGYWQLTTPGRQISNINSEEVRKFVKSLDIKSIESEEFNSDDEYDNIEIESKDEQDDDHSENEDIISPFAPKDIKIVVEPKTIDHLVARLRYDEIDMNTEFQRKGNLWKPDVQSRLIESILLRLPLPPFYFDASDDNKWLVVDGLQRLWSIRNFIINSERKQSPLELIGLEILTDYSGKGITFDKLNRTMQRRILETHITTYLIQPGTPKEVKYNVFRRINTGGLGLNSMEIRNALNQGKPSDFLRDLSEDEDLKSILRLQDKRMEDRELLLRAYAFTNKGYNLYEKPLSTFLDKAMESLGNKTEVELNKLRSGIIDAIFFQVELFGKHIFSRSISGSPNRVKLNSALFEVWVSEVIKLNKKQKTKVLENKAALILDYSQLFKIEDFVRSVATSTASKAAVKTRFESIATLLKKYSE